MDWRDVKSSQIK